MEERTIEVDVVSATGLKNVKTFGGHQTTYVVAYIVPQTKRSTKVDTSRGVNPTWNAKLTFLCDERILEKGGAHLTLEIYSQGVLSDTLIGKVSIPLYLPVASNANAGKSDGTPVEYSVRSVSGKERGLLKVGVKFGEKRTILKYAGTQPGLSYSQEYKKQSYPTASYGASDQHQKESYPPASYGTSNQQFYPGAFLNSGSAGSIYPRQPANVISPYPNSVSAGAVYPPPPPSSRKTESLTGYITSSGTTGVNVAAPPSSDSASSSSSEPVTAYPAMGYPVGGSYQPYNGQQYSPQGYPSQGYPNQSYPSQYYTQQPSYYAPAQQPYYSAPPKRHSSGSSGLGTGLLAADSQPQASQVSAVNNSEVFAVNNSQLRVPDSETTLPCTRILVHTSCTGSSSRNGMFHVEARMFSGLGVWGFRTVLFVWSAFWHSL
ncbi:hypothetical protein R1flu_002683 [Riccia fluitans]|uniref:C2 domain-containing protein n=1 Tax=Riccia fluitans TaxID=41844 RepID=A0ABD1Y6T4_9MARC